MTNNGRESEDLNKDECQILTDERSPNVEIVPLEEGRVMIRELDEAGNIVRETYGEYPGTMK
ncbi:hypothetical protein [Cohnella lupini]|uniref:Uncharacterized protein n=1 Tax=Cohnella lupini TaxID=1294267 RepID=A0A3D9HNT5_9BACL|nr:hypothetical protein [Cohnella lupini]RED51137.1 hypothetical protein DFP95_1478 [Cohnella lupini]